MLSPNARAPKERIFSTAVRPKKEKKGPLDKYLINGSPTRVCRRVSNKSSTMDKPTEYFDSARKTCKKTGSGDSSQIAYLTENLTKLNKSKKHSKTCMLLVR